MRNVMQPMIGLAIPSVALAGLALAFAQELPESPGERAQPPEAAETFAGEEIEHPERFIELLQPGQAVMVSSLDGQRGTISLELVSDADSDRMADWYESSSSRLRDMEAELDELREQSQEIRSQLMEIGQARTARQAAEQAVGMAMQRRQLRERQDELERDIAVLRERAVPRVLTIECVKEDYIGVRDRNRLRYFPIRNIANISRLLKVEFTEELGERRDRRERDEERATEEELGPSSSDAPPASLGPSSTVPVEPADPGDAPPAE